MDKKSYEEGSGARRKEGKKSPGRKMNGRGQGAAKREESEYLLNE